SGSSVGATGSSWRETRHTCQFCQCRGATDCCWDGGMTSSSVLPRPGSEREGFAVPADVAYFNTANLAPLLHSVRAAAEKALERRAAPWTITADDWFSEVETLRALVGELF